MIRQLLGRHGTLLLRSYFLLVAGLLLVAVSLDLGFRAFQSEHADDRWLRTTVQLLESELSTSNQTAALERLRKTTGLGVDLLPPEAIAQSGAVDGDLDTLIGDDGQQYFLYRAPKLDGVLRLGPVGSSSEPWLPRVLTALFYLSIFVVVGLWLRPLLLDIDRLTDAAHRFAADYREPLSTAPRTTRLTSLATDLDSMSARLSGMIQSQKELIAALSHEMRTPLTRIRFGLATLDQQDAEAYRQQIVALNDDVQDIDQLIGTMLNYARLDHPELSMNWQHVPITSWLSDTTRKQGRENVSVSVNLQDDLDTLHMDARLMGLALSNLLSNAVRHAKSMVLCTVASVGRDARLIVEDDGPGIPEAQRDTVMKAFSRLDDSRNRETGGFGLGLAIVARIAALHGGEVCVTTSEAFGGARFVIVWTSEPGIESD